MAHTLEERMSLTLIGQVTWAKPSIGQRCTACRHFSPYDGTVKRRKERGQGRCALVRVYMRRNGDLYIGKDAIACTMFSPDLSPAGCGK